MLKSYLEVYYPIYKLFYFIARFFIVSKECKWTTVGTRHCLAWTWLSFQSHPLRFFSSGLHSTFLIHLTVWNIAVCIMGWSLRLPLLGSPSLHIPSDPFLTQNLSASSYILQLLFHPHLAMRALISLQLLSLCACAYPEPQDCKNLPALSWPC
jgi:hypothetical protein